MLTDLKPIELIDHLLWPDGTIQVTPEKVIDFTFKLAAKKKIDHLSVTEITPEIKRFNSFGEHQLSIKTFVDPTLFPPDWVLPQHYVSLDLDQYLVNLVNKIIKDDLYEVRIDRLASEIYLFKQLKLEPILRVLIYIIDTMKDTGSIWGVGRGSSCSSYILFLIGLHEVDVVLYDIDITDFLRSP